jgi:tungstate transport system substrate-binding protein
VNSELAKEFVAWLTSVETQEMIGQFGVEEFGQPLFTPDSEEWRASQGE